MRRAMSARTESSEYCANRTSISVSTGSESKSCLAAKRALSLTGLHIYRCSCLRVATITSGKFGYAATIAPGCCSDAAPDRRNPGCVLGRPESVSRLHEPQELPQRGRGARFDEHDPNAEDRSA